MSCMYIPECLNRAEQNQVLSALPRKKKEPAAMLSPTDDGTLYGASQRLAYMYTVCRITCSAYFGGDCTSLVGRECEVLEGGCRHYYIFIALILSYIIYLGC